jgi:hypothetical protein
VDDVVGMKRYFRYMYEALINSLHREEARASTPSESPPHASVGTGSIHHEF